MNSIKAECVTFKEIMIIPFPVPVKETCYLNQTLLANMRTA